MTRSAVPTAYRDEARLIRAAQDGDVRAIEHLISRHVPVRGIVFQLRREIDPAARATDEVEAAARLALMESLRRFDLSRGVRFTTFAYPRIRGAMIDAVYPDGITGVRLVSLDEDELGSDRDGEPSFERELYRRDSSYGRDDGYERIERREVVERFVQRLPGSQRSVVRALYWDGNTHALVAAERGISRDGVTSVVRKVARRGRAELGNYYANDLAA
jgi:RNA polymerase sigma factor (sigma-70 family)